jgi:hypothetical protein
MSDLLSPHLIGQAKSLMMSLPLRDIINSIEAKATHMW